MAGPFHHGPKVVITAISGMLRVDIQHGPQPVAALFTLGVDVYFAWFLHGRWVQLSLLLKIIWIWGMVSSIPLLWFLLFGNEEVIEIDTNKLTIRKGFHGWERKHEYQIVNCSELEWQKSGKGEHPRLECKFGRRTISFGDDVSEADAVEILTALQRTLPEVAQKICAYPGEKEHFLTLGLNK
jgi:hypothetical protein